MASANRKIGFIGSNRQSIPDDFMNSGADKRGSCYPVTQRVCRAIGAEFDDFLLTDLYNNLSSGTTFKAAQALINQESNSYDAEQVAKNKPFLNWIHDESKLTLLYAQMHKVALENPNERIEFNFIDDRDDLLNQLQAYFTQYPSEIPPNVQLKLKQYRGPSDINGKPYNPQVLDYPAIQGTAVDADKAYVQTVKKMAAVTIEQMTQKGIDITGTKTTGPIRDYNEAKEQRFDMSAIRCTGHYTPDKQPAQPINEPAALPKSLSLKARMSSLGNLFQSSTNNSNNTSKKLVRKNSSPKPSPASSSSSSSGTSLKSSLNAKSGIRTSPRLFVPSTRRRAASEVIMPNLTADQTSNNSPKTDRGPSNHAPVAIPHSASQESLSKAREDQGFFTATPKEKPTKQGGSYTFKGKK